MAPGILLVFNKIFLKRGQSTVGKMMIRLPGLKI